MYYSKDIIDALQFIQDKAFCYRTGYKACKKFNEIQDQLVLEDKQVLFDILCDLYMNPNISIKKNHVWDCNTLVEYMPLIKNRQSADEQLFDGYHAYEEWTKLYGFKVTTKSKQKGLMIQFANERSMKGMN